MWEDNNYEMTNALGYIECTLECLKACDNVVEISNPPEALKQIFEYLLTVSDALADIRKEMEHPVPTEEALAQHRLAQDIFIDLGCCSRFAHQLNGLFQIHLSRTTQNGTLRDRVVLPRKVMAMLLEQMIGVIKYALYAWELVARNTRKSEAQAYCQRLAHAMRCLKLSEVDASLGEVDISIHETDVSLKKANTSKKEINLLPEEIDTFHEALDDSIEEADASTTSEAATSVKQEIDNLGEERGIFEDFANNGDSQQFHATNRGFKTNDATETTIDLVKVKDVASQSPAVVGNGIQPQEEEVYHGETNCNSQPFDREVIPNARLYMRLPYHMWRHGYRAIIGLSVAIVFITKVVQRFEHF